MLKYIYSKYLLQVKIEPPKVSLIKKELAWLLRAFLIGTNSWELKLYRTRKRINLFQSQVIIAFISLIDKTPRRCEVFRSAEAYGLVDGHCKACCRAIRAALSCSICSMWVMSRECANRALYSSISSPRISCSIASRVVSLSIMIPVLARQDGYAICNYLCSLCTDLAFEAFAHQLAFHLLCVGHVSLGVLQQLPVRYCRATVETSNALMTYEMLF